MDEKIYFKDFFNLVKNNKIILSSIFLISIALMTTLSFILPKSFKSEFDLNIYSQYFNNTLISEVVPGISTTTEMTQTIESMMKEVLNDEFIDSLALELNFYPKNLDSLELAKRRSNFRDQLELYNNGGTTYHVGFITNDPQKAFWASQKILEAVKTYFIDSRLKTLEFAQETIIKKLESLSVSRSLGENNEGIGPASKNPDALQLELNKVDQEISLLRMQYNDKHPSVIKLQKRKYILLKILKDFPREKRVITKVKNETPLFLSGDKETAKQIAFKLYSNLNNLNIALDLERKNVGRYIAVTKSPQIPIMALFPKKRVFFSLGVAVGLVLSLLYLAFIEMTKKSRPSEAEALAITLSTSFLGTMPFISEERLFAKEPLLTFPDDEKNKKNNEVSTNSILIKH